MEGNVTIALREQCNHAIYHLNACAILQSTCTSYVLRHVYSMSLSLLRTNVFNFNFSWCCVIDKGESVGYCRPLKSSYSKSVLQNTHGLCDKSISQSEYVVLYRGARLWSSLLCTFHICFIYIIFVSTLIMCAVITSRTLLPCDLPFVDFSNFIRLLV